MKKFNGKLRLLSLLMAFALLFTTVTNTSFTSYAEDDEIVSEETVEPENSQQTDDSTLTGEDVTYNSDSNENSNGGVSRIR